jgi:hypothetical protein
MFHAIYITVSVSGSLIQQNIKGSYRPQAMQLGIYEK